METLLYILKSATALSILFIGYSVLMRKETNFKLHRQVLWAIVILSLILPAFTVSIPHKEVQQLNTSMENVHTQENIEQEAENAQLIVETIKTEEPNTFQLSQIIPYLKWLYFIGFVLFTLFLLVQLLFIILTVIRTLKVKDGNFRLIQLKQVRSPFSFLNWIFIPQNEEIKNIDQIIEHEKIHASQLHSIDVFVIELLAAAMWFNPFVWMMRRQFKLVHEYLADEGALGTGIDKLQYQALLLNHAVEERLISLSSGFNPVNRLTGTHFIKKRMTMISTNKSKQKTTWRLIGIIPLGFILVISVLLANQIFPEPVKASEPESDFPEIPSQISTSLISNEDNVSLAIEENKPTADNSGENESVQPPVQISERKANDDKHEKLLNDIKSQISGNSMVLIAYSDKEGNLDTKFMEVENSLTTEQLNELKSIDPVTIKKVQVIKGEAASTMKDMVKPEDLNTNTNSGFEKNLSQNEIVTAVQPVKMNVLFAGIENPVTVAVSDIPSNELTINITNGKYKKMGSGSYYITPSKPGNLRVHIMHLGKEIGITEFRVKMLPNPVVKVNNQKRGAISKKLLVAQHGVVAVMEDFDFDATFKVTSFTVSTTSNGYTHEEISNSNKFTQKQKGLMMDLQRGDRIFITDIKAVGPTGKTRNLASIDFIIK